MQKQPTNPFQLCKHDVVSVLLCKHTRKILDTHEFCAVSKYVPESRVLQRDLEGRARATIQRTTFSPVQEARGLTWSCSRVSGGRRSERGISRSIWEKHKLPRGRERSRRCSGNLPAWFTGRLCMWNARKCYASGGGSCVRQGRRVWGAWKGLETGIWWGNERCAVATNTFSCTSDSFIQVHGVKMASLN